MVELRYTTPAGRGVTRSVPDARIEKAIRGMFQARIECEAFNERDELVGEVHQAEDAVVPDGRGGEREYNGLAWWCDDEPNAQEHIDERAEAQ